MSAGIYWMLAYKEIHVLIASGVLAPILCKGWILVFVHLHWGYWRAEFLILASTLLLAVICLLLLLHATTLLQCFGYDPLQLTVDGSELVSGPGLDGRHGLLVDAEDKVLGFIFLGSHCVCNSI